ncbi:hypothetical protein CsSME_00012509 [Camellia sinensis var. sinensis]
MWFYLLKCPNFFPRIAFSLNQNGKFSYGYASSLGKRSTMEDFYETRIDGVDGEIVGLFGVFDDFSKGWHLCQLEVLDCKKVAWPNSVTEEKYCVEDCGWPLKEFAYEWKINLLTGRTHQVGDDIRMMI